MIKVVFGALAVLSGLALLFAAPQLVRGWYALLSGAPMLRAILPCLMILSAVCAAYVVSARSYHIKLRRQHKQ